MSGPKVLVVDDNLPNRRLANAILSSAGYTVELAESGPQALELFAAGPPALVLLDVIMPGMDGFETLGRLRALPEGPTTPVVIVTALTDLQSVQRAIECGADDFISKPFNRTELLVRAWSLISRGQRLATTAAASAATAAPPAPPAVDAAKPNMGKDDLMNMIVHDLKHPLATIYFNAGLLRRDTGLSPRNHDKVARILRASETLESMIMSVLDVARGSDSGLPLRLAELDVCLLAEEVVANMSPQAEANQQRIELLLSTPHAAVRADNDVMRRILENLVDNAIKYAPPDTVVRVCVDLDAEGVELRVRDSGPGIPPAQRAMVFQKYVQLERDTAHGRRGRGLGLVFVRLAAEAHGGSVTIEDQPGGGTCFCVRIPRREAIRALVPTPGGASTVHN